MLVTRDDLLDLAPIADMQRTKQAAFGVSFGLTESGYDIRIAETVKFSSYRWDERVPTVEVCGMVKRGRFTLASAMEYFQMPDNLTGRVCDKSTWARQGLSVFNTVIEPGWQGYLTLELVYHGTEGLVIPAGAGIAQVLFEQTSSHSVYGGKYQNQEAGPQEARESK